MDVQGVFRIKTIACIFLLLAGFSAALRAETPGEVGVGQQLREARLDGLLRSGNRLSDFRGKPLIINVWASWCGPCRAEMGSLERLAGRFNGRAFNVVGISTDDDRSAAEAFLKYAKVTFPNYIDHQLVLENMLGANRIPLTILVAADGRVLGKVEGARAWDSPKSLDFIAATFALH